MMETCAADPATGAPASIETVEEVDAARQAQLITGSHDGLPNLMTIFCLGLHHALALVLLADSAPPWCGLHWLRHLSLYSQHCLHSLGM